MPIAAPAVSVARPLHWSVLLLGGAFAVPLLWSLLASVGAGADARAWAALAAQAETAPALWMSTCTGVAATALAWSGAALLLSLCSDSGPWERLLRPLPAMLAMPHAAFAVGFVLLMAPAGWVMRGSVALLAPFNSLLGLPLDAPPPWPTTQDPWGMGLIAVLAFKEIPFLLWSAAAQLQQPDLARRLAQDLQVAQSLGYPPHTAWWRVVWPQLVGRLRAPLLAVLVFNLTVVDVALLAGPTTPPTLSVLAWQWLQDADAARNAMGAAAAWALAGLALFIAMAGAMVRHGARRWRVRRQTRGVALRLLRPDATSPKTIGQYCARWGQQGAQGWGTAAVAAVLPAAYGAVALALALGSVIGVWPFPALWPQDWTWQAWQAVIASAALVGTTLALGLGSAGAALLWSVAWLECAPTHWQRRTQDLWYLPLLVPVVLWAMGLHRLTLAWGLQAQASGMWLAHTLCVLPYVLLSLQGAYGGFDARLQNAAASLGHSRWAFVWRVKWPLLRAALCASFAVGFAVSVAQYLPTLYVGAGRFTTVTTEAVALASGGARSLLAAFAALLWLLPALVFGLAAWLGRPRQF